jgi:hypothetical protein
MAQRCHELERLTLTSAANVTDRTGFNDYQMRLILTAGNRL